MRNPITLSEVKNYFSKYFGTEKVIPAPSKKGAATYEGHYIEKLNNCYKLYWQRHNPLNPFQAAERHEETYNDFDKLVRDYIKREYKFNIDGLKIVA